MDLFRNGIIISLFVFTMSVHAVKIGIRSRIRPVDVSVTGSFTNSIFIRLTPEKKGGSLNPSDVECRFPGDPSFKGTTTLRSALVERVRSREGRILERSYRIDFIFEPKYQGNIVLKPLPVHFIQNGKTNTVMTPRKSVYIAGEKSGIVIWIFAAILLFAGAGTVSFNLVKRNRKQNTTDITNAGGHDGD